MVVSSDKFEERRKALVEHLEESGIIKISAIKKAMLKIKREDFLPTEQKENAYDDTPLPIPGGVTISAPHMHCIFLSSLKLKSGDKVLEVGFGSGILLAYIREIVGPKGKVVGIEFVPETYEFGKRNLERAGYKDIKLFLGDGSQGVPQEAPFDKIVSGASAPEIPKPWIEQLKPGGIIVTPVGPMYGEQDLIYVEKTKEGKIIKKNLGGVIFVQLFGKYGFRS